MTKERKVLLVQLIRITPIGSTKTKSEVYQ